jgi:hypothetical protein
MAYDHNGASAGDGDDWVDDKALEAAKMEAQVFGRGPNGEGETPAATLRRLFEENSAKAAMNIISMASNAASERIRFDANKYIVERVLGPLSATNNDGAPGSLEHTLAEMEKNISGGGSEGR